MHFGKPAPPPLDSYAGVAVEEDVQRLVLPCFSQAGSSSRAELCYFVYDDHMLNHSPNSIPSAEWRQLRAKILQLARSIGFIGLVEYRHVYSQTGGAQYGRGTLEAADLLIVFAEAFERDADREDFSLMAIIAHERGHQLLARHPKLSIQLAGVSLAAEEVLASLLEAMVVEPGDDRDALIAKATVDVLSGGRKPEEVVRIIEDLWAKLEELL